MIFCSEVSRVYVLLCVRVRAQISPAPLVFLISPLHSESLMLSPESSHLLCNYGWFCLLLCFLSFFPPFSPFPLSAPIQGGLSGQVALQERVSLSLRCIAEVTHPPVQTINPYFCSEMQTDGTMPKNLRSQLSHSQWLEQFCTGEV